MTAYYNEIAPFCAAWLTELIRAGHIAPGEVDTRSIEDVCPADLSGFTQCHFFAGIGVWSYALRRAGWSDDRPVWTGNCPCQPFSAAGKGGGFADERHLWPAWYHLISLCHPGVIFGEQVASPDGLAWLDLVQADLEAEAYACGAVAICAAGVGAPHIRQRLYWVADAEGRRGGAGLCDPRQGGQRRHIVANGRSTGGLATPPGAGWKELASPGEAERRTVERPSTSCRMADACSDAGRAEHGEEPGGRYEGPTHLAKSGSNGKEHGTGPTDNYWRAADWLLCRDGKWRPVEPGTCPLAHGAAARVGRLRGYGNAIVAPQAEAFIKVAMSVL